MECVLEPCFRPARKAKLPARVGTLYKPFDETDQAEAVSPLVKFVHPIDEEAYRPSRKLHGKEQGLLEFFIGPIVIDSLLCPLWMFVKQLGAKGGICMQQLI
jgi:hypothetical protein